MNKIKGILNNTELGKMKDELCSSTKDDEIPNQSIEEALFLKANAYCYTTVEGEEEKMLKGKLKLLL